MLYTIARFGRSGGGGDTFLGTLINKCRQVVQKNLPKSTKYNEINKISDNLSNSYNCTQQKQMTPISNVNATTNVPIPMRMPLPIVTNNANESYRSDSVRNLMLNNNSMKAVKSVEEQIGLPPRPKKPLTTYFRFMKEERDKILATQPKIKITELIRQVSKQWNTIDPNIKQRLNDEFQRDRKKYAEIRAKYDAQLTEEDRLKIKELKSQLREAKVKQLLRKKVKELGRPKRPASSFIRFLSNERIVTPQLPQQSFRDWHQKVTNKWNNLSAADKDVFVKAAHKELEAYRKQLNDWEQQMIKSGHKDVVRCRTLIEPKDSKPKNANL